MEPVFGIISWLPDNEKERAARLKRLNFTLMQLQTYWPSIDIMILGQNWKNTRPHPLNPRKVTYHLRMGRPGILAARKMLREEFLKTGYGWMIMTDDDVILKMPVPFQETADELLARIKKNPHGFAFVKDANGDRWFPEIPYKSAALNFAIVSRYIYEKEPWHNYDAERGIASEDVIFSYLLHCKYADLEFDIPDGISHVQNDFNPDRAPSTWVPLDEADRYALAEKLWCNTKEIIDYIKVHHDLPTE